MTERHTVVPGQIEGSFSGCPFCTSCRIGIPKIGTKFRIISGSLTGATGKVVKWHKTVPKIENEFMAQLNNEPKEWQIRISIERQLIQKLPVPPVPKWAPPLCLKDASELDKSVVKFCEKSFRHGKWKIDWDTYNGVIWTIWHNRLPIESNELWNVLQAHGVPRSSKRNLLGFYKRGCDLLIYAVGKKPIKKKRVRPLSV